MTVRRDKNHTDASDLGQCRNTEVKKIVISKKVLSKN